MKKNWTRILALGLSALLMLSACGGTGGTTESPAAGSESPAAGSENTPAASTATKENPDELVVAISTEPASLDPHNVNMVTAFTLAKQVFDRLFVADEEYNITPSLATEYEWVDDTTLRVKLREDVYFTNGQQLTADDVVYTIQRACTMAQSATTFENFDPDNTAAVDQFTVDIKLKAPYPNALTVLASGRGSIVCKSAIEEMGEDAYGRTPVGSGKFIVTNWNSGDRIEMVRNEDYWGEKPAFKNMTFRILTDGSTRGIELETGGVDIALEVSTNDLERLNANPDIKIIQGAGSTMNHIVINSVNFDTLTDVNVRKAMHMALDMNALVQLAFQGNATVASSLVPDVTVGYTKVGPMEYDPEGAKALIEESGFDTSKEIVMNIYQNERIQAMAEAIANMWTAIGLNVKIEMIDRATLTTNNSSGQTPMCITTVTASDGNIEGVFRMWETRSYAFTDDEDLIGRIKAAKNIVDDDERMQAYAELQQECWDLHTVIPICVEDKVYGIRSYVQGFEFQPDNSPDFSKVTFS